MIAVDPAKDDVRRSQVAYPTGIVPSALYDRLLAAAEETGGLASARSQAESDWRANIARAESEAIRSAVGMVAFIHFFVALAPAFRALARIPAPYPEDVWPPGWQRVTAERIPAGWTGIDVSFQTEHDAQAARRRLRVPARAYNPFRCAVARDVLAERWEPDHPNLLPRKV